MEVFQFCDIDKSKGFKDQVGVEEDLMKAKRARFLSSERRAKPVIRASFDSLGQSLRVFETSNLIQ